MISPAASIYENNIIVPIAVLPPLIVGKDPRLVCPPFIVHPGDWLIVWELVTIHYAQLAHATFPDEGGIFEMPGHEQAFTSSTRISDTQWVVSIINEPQIDKPKVFAIPYGIGFLYPTPGNPNPVLYTSENRNVIRQDPTIVVSQDPVEGY
ncbi:MAG TPA: hypothetical protein VN783_09050 [Thermoanaerobaculia bacterium]|nr:hypothetical protein [Thermoanaerobaculia bacterium]